MNEQRLAENEWREIVLNAGAGVLELRWRTDIEMSDPGFMATLALLALTAERVMPSRVLIDASDFRHRFGDGIMEWRNQTMIPRYGAAGVRRFAFIMPDGFPDIGSESVEHPAVFTTAWFATREEAMAWLASS